MIRLLTCMLVVIAAAPVTSAQSGTISPEDAAKEIDALLSAESTTYGAISKKAAKQGATKPRPSRPIDDYGFLRRASLDITGKIPTLNEIEDFVSDRQRNKRRELVDRLLDDPDYGANWASYWRDVVFYRRTEDRSIVVAKTMTDYLTATFNKNTPWDAVARSFVTAKGDIKQNGQTAIIAAQGGRPEESVAEMSRIFLGVQIQCAQCHDHPTDRWTREQFHELAAFYPRTYMRPKRDGDERTFLVTTRERAPRRKTKADRHNGKVEHYMPDLDDPSAEGTLMQPVFFLTGDKLEHGTSDADRRHSLADWMTDPSNAWFAKALVNRMWAELIGNSFYPNVDDLGPDRDCVYPETLDYLASAFVNSDYNMKWLMRTITSTDVYHRKSLSRNEITDLSFTVPLQQRLRSDQVFDALIEFLSFDQPEAKRRLAAIGRRGPRIGFNRVFGYDPSEPRDEIAGSVPQALLLMNGKAVNRLISAKRKGSGLGRMLQDVPEDELLVTELYLRALSRRPSRREIAKVKGHLAASESRSEAYEDLIWALINSSEFIHRS